MDRFVSPLEVKFAAGDAADAMTFSGYGAVFGNVDAGGDLIEPGAFADTLAATRKNGRWPAMLLQHGALWLTADDLTPIGVWTDLREDARGLVVEGKLADTARGREAYALMKMTPRPAITGLSIGYVVKDAQPRRHADEPARTLRKLDLIEVSLVTFPMNPEACVSSVKSWGPRELEAALRELGLTHRQAKRLVAGGHRAMVADSEAEAARDSQEIAALLRDCAGAFNPS